MLTRTLQEDILASLRSFPAVALLGARQVGKTTLARLLARDLGQESIYLDLERPSDRARLSEPELFLARHVGKLVILDEAQRMPDLFPLLRSLIDENRRPGRFLLLGSAAPSLKRQSAESLAGRIRTHELSSFSIAEVGATKPKIERLWLRGGFPESFLAESDARSFVWRDTFIRTWLERDIPALGIRTPTPTIHRFWQMLAHLHGQLWNGSSIAQSMGVSDPMVRRYLDILDDTFMIRQITPYHANLKKRLVKSPKVYFRDCGLLHALLGLESMDDLLGHPASGVSWEGWIVEQIVAALPAGWRAHFFRTSAGAEIDLVVTRTGRRRPLAFEIKRSLTPVLTRGFHSAMEDVKPEEAFVVYPGTDSYPMAKSVRTLPVGELPSVLAGWRRKAK
jgi:uncharacterized protein